MVGKRGFCRFDDFLHTFGEEANGKFLGKVVDEEVDPGIILKDGHVSHRQFAGNCGRLTLKIKVGNSFAHRGKWATLLLKKQEFKVLIFLVCLL